MLAGAACAIAIGDAKLAAARLEDVVATINAMRAERHAQFGARDPFGKGVLSLAKRLRKEHRV
jgi:hypothetical protein